MKTLIVDDKEDARYLLEVLLKGHGHGVELAENGAQALEKLKGERFDLIVTDILMPVMDGFQLCRRVKTDEALKHIPLIFYTATYTGPKDEEFAQKIGADGFLRKPAEPQTFMETVRALTGAAAKGGTEAGPGPAAADETEVYKLYNERLVRKLEQKMLALDEEVRRRESAENGLRESNTRLQLALRSSKIGLWDWDLRTNEVYYSPEWKRQIGYEDREIQGRYGEWEQRLHPEDRPRVLALVEAYLKGQVPEYALEFRFRHKDGSYRWIAVRGETVPGPDGSPIRFMGCHLDITAQKNMEGRLRQAQKMEAIGTLAGGIAHDFNNILSAMIGFAELARDDLPPDNPALESIAEVLTAGLRAKDLVKHILAFSRATESERVPVAMDLIVREALALIRSSLPSTIEIRQDVAPSGRIFGDATQMHQVVMNLCTNAFHAMEERGGVLDVALRSMTLDADTAARHPGLSPGPYVRLSVVDTGTGMSADVLERIFDPYFTTKGEGRGTGLGLAVVHGIVTSHGGRISVYSESGKGSAFHVYLPRMESGRSEKAVSPEGPLPRGNERILFVDDEVPIATLGKRMLESLGYEVTARSTSEEALEFFRAGPERFDAVITDMTMPRMTGVELAGELARIRPGIPVILCTGFSHAISEAKAKAMGIREFVMKPFIKQDLATAVRRALDGPPLNEERPGR